MDPKIEMEVKMGLTSAEMSSTRVLFPDARRFEELFDEVFIVEDRPHYQSFSVCSWDLEEGGECHIDSSCWVRGSNVALHLDVTPSEKVMDALHDNMLMSRDYVYNFEITVRDNGTALVHAKYDRILGSRWFAIIDASTIPGLTEAMAQEAADEQMVAELDEKEKFPVLDLFGPNPFEVE